MKEPDPALLQRCRQHDAEAFAQLVAEQQDYVYTLARRVLRDPEEAADLTQEILLRIWQGLPYFRGEARFRTWLYRIAVNQCLNRLRKLQRERDTVGLDEETVQWLADGAQDLPAEALERERRTFVWEQVERLPAHYRIVLNLFYQQEMPCAEIADVLGIPVATVKTHLHRARAALADALPQGGSDVL
jgi:RNA polymerase sigma-70 factor (ECF subfamily)